VLRLRGGHFTGLSRAMAAVLDSPRGKVLSHASAAAVWGVPGFELRGAMHTAVPRQGMRKRTRLAVVHFHQDMPLEETVLRNGIPVTSPTLLAFHLAAQVHPARAERAFDYLQSRHLTTAERLQNLVDDIGGKGRNGIRVAREMAKAAEGRPPTESGLERRVEWFAGQGGVKIRRQIGLGDDDFIGRVDFDLVERPGVLEAQSITYHASPLSAASDAERIRRLLGIGRSVMTIWDYQAFQHGSHVIDQIQAFARALDLGLAPFHLDCPDP
jgi:very-short-patch-repair endonuclease